MTIALVCFYSEQIRSK